MKQRKWVHYTEDQKALMWERWQKGESLQHIAQLFDRSHSSVQGILSKHGGIRPLPRRRSRLALSLAAAIGKEICYTGVAKARLQPWLNARPVT